MLPTPRPATISQPQAGLFVLSGGWTVHTLAGAAQKLAVIGNSETLEVVVDGSQLATIDSLGVWLLQQQFTRIRTAGRSVRLLDWPVNVQKLLDVVENQIEMSVLRAANRSSLEKIGRKGEAAWQGMFALFSFIGECALALVRIGLRPNRWRWQQVLKNIEISGFDTHHFYRHHPRFRLFGHLQHPGNLICLSQLIKAILTKRKTRLSSRSTS